MSRPDPFDVARDVASKSDPMVTRYRHGAVIMNSHGRIISHGTNHYKGNIIETIEGPIRKTIHAEIHALSKINVKTLDKSTIISYGSTNVAAILARPCDNCWVVLSRLGFTKVFYSVRSSLTKPLWKEEWF